MRQSTNKSNLDHLEQCFHGVDCEVCPGVGGLAHSEIRDVERSRVLADNHQGRGHRHRALHIHLLHGPEGVLRVVVVQQNDGLVEEQSRKYQSQQCPETCRQRYR